MIKINGVWYKSMSQKCGDSETFWMERATADEEDISDAECTFRKYQEWKNEAIG